MSPPLVAAQVQTRYSEPPIQSAPRSMPLGGAKEPLNEHWYQGDEIELGRDCDHRRPGAGDRHVRSHLLLPAVQYSVGLDEGNASDWRLSVRLEALLRLQQIFLSVQSRPVFGPHLRR